MWRGCILWRHHVEGCTHQWRISIIPHGHVCSRVSLHMGIDRTALPLGVPFDHNQFSHRTCTELLAFRIFNPLKMDSCNNFFFF